MHKFMGKITHPKAGCPSPKSLPFLVAPKDGWTFCLETMLGQRPVTPKHLLQTERSREGAGEGGAKEGRQWCFAKHTMLGTNSTAAVRDSAFTTVGHLDNILLFSLGRETGVCKLHTYGGQPSTGSEWRQWGEEDRGVVTSGDSRPPLRASDSSAPPGGCHLREGLLACEEKLE